LRFLSDWGWQEKEILITVKAYPNPSKKYTEAVCVAGVSEGKWIRLYPVKFRNLPAQKAFKKYELIRVKVKKSSDPRPESYYPDLDSIKKIAYFDTKNDSLWEKRNEYLIPTASESMCEILRLQKINRKSLGMFKPKDVSEFKMIKEEDEWSPAEQVIQLSLVEPNIDPVERLPFSFKYYFRCNDKSCNGHKMKLIDWEAGELYRKLKNKYLDNYSLIEEKMREKWLVQLFSSKRNTYFFVGNIRAYPNSFVILGVFWPPKVTEKQQSMFDFS
jgi:hypothetical protein